MINAPAKLDTLTQQVVAVTARIPESERILGQLRTEFDDAALASIGDNIAEATERVRFADSRITHGRELAARPLEGQQMSLVDAIRGAESALTQANALLDAIDNAANNIRHATDSLAASLADTKSDIAQAEEFQKQGRLPSSEELTKAHDAAVAAVADAERIGATDPLTAFTHLAAADAQLDKLLAAAQEERAAAERRARVLDQALVAARQRLDAVNQYIGLHRGAVGARTRWNLDEAQRRLAAAEQSRASNPSDAILRQRRRRTGDPGPILGTAGGAERSAVLRQRIRRVQRGRRRGRQCRRRGDRRNPARHAQRWIGPPQLLVGFRVVVLRRILPILRIELPRRRGRF